MTALVLPRPRKLILPPWLEGMKSRGRKLLMEGQFISGQPMQFNSEANLGHHWVDDSPLSVWDIIDRKGLATSIVLCLDAGDSASATSASSQSWVDRAGNSNFQRGETSGSTARDPTFVGTVGDLLDTTYYQSDGGDYFDSNGAPSWDDNWNNTGATYTLAVVIYIPQVANSFKYIVATQPSVSHGFYLQINSANNLYYTLERTNTFNDFLWGNQNGFTNGWAMLLVSMNVGGSSFWNVNGAISTFTATVSNTQGTIVGDVGILAQQPTSINAINPCPSGTRLGAVMAWNRQLSQSETQTLYSELKKRRWPTLP